MELFEAGHEIKYLGIRRVTTGVIRFGRPNDDIDHVGEAAAATAALLHGVIDLCRHDELPTVLVEKAVDHVDDFFFGDEVAAANQHFVLPAIRKVLNFRGLSKRGYSLSRMNRTVSPPHSFRVVLILTKDIAFSAGYGFSSNADPGLAAAN